MKTITLKLFFFLTCLMMSSECIYSQTPDFSLVGFATENGGTTGGTGGIEVTVSTFADLRKYARIVDTKYIIKIAGTIKGTGTMAGRDYNGEIKVASNKTIVGIGDSAFLDGIGLAIKDAKNIIIQNIKFSMASVGQSIPPGLTDIEGVYSALGDEGRAQILVNEGDLIRIYETSSNVWIDHCEFFNEDPRVQLNQDLYDGLVDVNHTSGFVTISWCYFHDHHKSNLIGGSDKAADLYADRKVTFHHNYYKTIQERVPLYRGSTGHFFNNYNYDVYAGSVNTRMGACVKVEKNYFEKCKSTVYSANSTVVGKAERIDNKEVDCGPSAYPGDCVASIPYSYSNVLNNVDDVKTIVMNYAGVGKLNSLSVGNFAIDQKATLYPNPFDKTISINYVGKFDYFVYNMAGMEIEKGKGSDVIKIGENYNSGVYIVKIVSDKGSSSEKIIKK